jgi:transposase
MSDVTTAVAVPVSTVTLTIGLDVGDRYSHACVVDSARKVLEEFRFPTDRAGLAKKFGVRPACQIVLEVGPHSRWMQRSLEELGHRVRVVDARKVELIAKGTMKTDRRDAHTLALLGAGVPELLGDIRHRSEQAHADLSVLLTRDHMIDLRTATINRVRGVLKAYGLKVPRMSTRAFHTRVGMLVPQDRQPAIVPLLEMLGAIHLQIKKLDDAIQQIAKRYPAVQRLTQVDGVGTLTALAYALSIDDPSRFKKSRDVGPFVGLCPRKHSSGDSDPKLSITRAGNPFLRRILVQSAQYVLGPHGPDCELRRHGEKLVRRGGKCAKKRAVVAVARKLSVLLHRLWVDDTPYDPWHQRKRRGEAPPEPPPRTTRKPKVTRLA